MKKQHKKASLSLRNRLFGTPKRACFSFIGLVAIIFATYIAYGYIWTASYAYRATTDHASADSIRTLILQAAKNVVKDAPVEAKTGDVYFPEAKLYLPQPTDYVNLGYSIPTDDRTSLHVADRLVLSNRESHILAAQNVDEVFERIPKFQACSRGVFLTYGQQKPDDIFEPELKQTIQLSNGKTLYAYIEKACQENSGTALLLKQLRPY